MAVRLLFDANLSPRLISQLSDAFPNSMHVSKIGGLAGDDLLIWNHARDHGLIIVSKDGDFQHLSFLRAEFEQSEDAALFVVDGPI